MNKPRRMRLARYEVCMERRAMHILFWWKSQKERTTRKTDVGGG
jgi:hypothetical protein